MKVLLSNFAEFFVNNRWAGAPARGYQDLTYWAIEDHEVEYVLMQDPCQSAGGILQFNTNFKVISFVGPTTTQSRRKPGLLVCIE